MTGRIRVNLAAPGSDAATVGVEEAMQALQSNHQRADVPDAAHQARRTAVDRGAALSARLVETLDYLTELQERLLSSARGIELAALPFAVASEHGASRAAVRIRRSRQAGAIHGAVKVLLELAREQSQVEDGARR